MKRLVLSLIAVCMLSVAVPAGAVICTIDVVPAATLLLPYFEVNLDDPNGLTTLFSINNASATAMLTHVTVWSDLSVPVLDFPLYLTGYDVQTINLRDVFNGSVPVTASDGQDPIDRISPQGLKSQDVDFASCADFFPPPPLPPVLLDHVRRSLTGRPSPVVLGGFCAGRALGDNIARGYITVDTVNRCSLLFPGDQGYFGPGGTGEATNQNTLWGDYFYVNDTMNFASGNPMVHIEASATNPQTSTPGMYTFYGRYVSWNATDNREPLATTFAGRFVTGGTFDGGTSYVVWRDSKVVQNAFHCPVTPGVNPPWYPLGQEGIVIFDEQEHPETAITNPFSPQPPQTGLVPFPAEAQRTKIGGEDFPVPFQFGWLYLDLNTTVVAAGSNPPEDPAAAQAWVTVQMDSKGRFSVGFEAIQLDSACTASHFVP